MKNTVNNTHKVTILRDNLVYIILTTIFVILAGIAVFLFFQIIGTESVSSPNIKSTATISPVSILPTAVPQPNKTLRNDDFFTEYASDMKLTETPMAKGKKYSFANKEINYEIYIGTDWMKADIARNFNNKKNTINNIPSYNFSDYLTFISFDLIGPNTKKHVSIKCTYDSEDQSLLERCYKLVDSFNLTDK